LFDRSFDCEVYGDRFRTESRAADQKFDYQCAIGQLPCFYRRTEESFPGTPYIKADPEQRIQWRALFDTFKGKKVGVAWRGGLPNTGEKRRSLDVSDYGPIFNDEDTFISLEYKPVDKLDLAKYNIKSYPRATQKGGKIDDLAAMIAELDYVVTSCTTVVYVAGSLGVPCFVMVPEHPGYRYHTNGEFSWYESVTLIRQLGGESWKATARRARKIISESCRSIEDDGQSAECSVELHAVG
jgi:hypothetical protein